MHTRFSHGASLSPKRRRQVRRDLGVSAAMWEGLDLVHTRVSHGAPIPSRPGKTIGTRVYLPLCGRGWMLGISGFPTGRPYPPSGAGNTGGSPVSPPLCGSGWIMCIPSCATGRPYPPSGLDKTGETRVSAPCVRVARSWAYPVFARSVPIRQAAQA